MSVFSENLKQLRREKGVSQTVIAEYLGMTKQAYSLYETGRREPNFENLCKLAAFFDTDVNHLLSVDEDPKVPDDKLKFALFGDTEIDNEVLDDVLTLAKLHLELRKSKEQEKKEDGGKKRKK